MAKAKWSKTRELIAKAQKILAAEQPMTLRQLYYRLVSAEVLENTRSDYCRLSRVLTRAREEDDIPFDWNHHVALQALKVIRR
jgi:hypothetical protein